MLKFVMYSSEKNSFITMIRMYKARILSQNSHSVKVLSKYTDRRMSRNAHINPNNVMCIGINCSIDFNSVRSKFEIAIKRPNMIWSWNDILSSICLCISLVRRSIASGTSVR